MEVQPTIHLVDDDESFVTALSRLLRAAGYAVRSHASAGDFLLAELDDTPGCVLLDLCLPGPRGLDLQRAIAARPDSLPIIFLSGRGDIPSTVRAMKAGAVDFLTKPVKRDVLLNAVQVALAQDAENRAERLRMSAWIKRFESLTPREHEVLDGVLAGKLNKQIADELGAAERTVKAHRAKIMEKMCAGSVAELVHIADQLRASEVALQPLAQ